MNKLVLEDTWKYKFISKALRITQLKPPVFNLNKWFCEYYKYNWEWMNEWMKKNLLQ